MKTKNLVIRRYFSLTFRQDIKTYTKVSNVCLSLKIVCHKLYKNIRLLPISNYHLKNLFMDFVISFLFFIDRKGKNYDVILVIVDCQTKLIYYELIKSLIDTASLTKVIINIIIKNYSQS